MAKYILVRCPTCGLERLLLWNNFRRSVTGGICQPCWAKQATKRYAHLASAKSLKHGKTDSRVYQTWEGIKQRCLNPNDKAYHNYGGRGITVCQRWHDFQNFLADMGEPPLGTSIERRDNNGNYCPGNCYWATRKQQANNQRNNRVITYNGETGTMKQMATKYGIPYSRLIGRLNVMHWTIERALTEPIKHPNLKR